ncbi:AraC family transcriptional regulator [Stappia sp. ICDLI1TA098]|jgi:AraC-like DNA-binding protein
MRNISLETVDRTPRAVLPIATDHAPGTLLETHRHRRAQLLYSATGLMEVETPDGAWVVPTHAGVWIPAGQPHRVHMIDASTRSLYVEPADAPRPARRCEVLVVSPLLHQLLLATADIPPLYDETGRDGVLLALVLHEIREARSVPLFAPLPQDDTLAALCKEFLREPHLKAAPDAWARRLNTSRRTFSRHFRQETGMSFSVWRRQACLLAAIPRLSAGASVTEVALDLGYESPSAFSTMFHRVVGDPPTRFVRQDVAPRTDPYRPQAAARTS